MSANRLGVLALLFLGELTAGSGLANNPTRVSESLVFLAAEDGMGFDQYHELAGE